MDEEPDSGFRILDDATRHLAEILQDMPGVDHWNLGFVYVDNQGKALDVSYSPAGKRCIVLGNSFQQGLSNTPVDWTTGGGIRTSAENGGGGNVIEFKRRDRDEGTDGSGGVGQEES